MLATQPKLLSVNLTNNLISDVQPGAFAPNVEDRLMSRVNELIKSTAQATPVASE